MIDLKYPLLISQIQQYQLLDINVLKKILPQQSSFIFFSNLIFDSQLDNTNYSKLRTYIQELFNQYFSIEVKYTSVEQEYLIFYTILKVQGNSFSNTNEIILAYNNLPILNTDNILFKWIIYRIKLDILSYYTYLNDEEKIYQLIDDINNTSDEVKLYNP